MVKWFLEPSGGHIGLVPFGPLTVNMINLIYLYGQVLLKTGHSTGIGYFTRMGVILCLCLTKMGIIRFKGPVNNIKAETGKGRYVFRPPLKVLKRPDG